MPKVPEYGQSRVTTQVVPEANAQAAPAGAFGGDIGRAVQGLGSQLQQMQERAGTAKAEQALTQFEREKNALFFDPDNGYFNSSGRTAYERAPQIGKQLDELKRQYAENLDDDFARRAFTRAADQHLTRAQQDIMRHASRNLQAWEAANMEAQVENTIENATLYWNDAERLRVQRELGRQSVMDAAKMQGLDGDALNEKLQTFESTFAASTIEAATADGSVAGKEALEKYGDRLEGPQKLKLEQMIAKREKAEKTAETAQLSVLKATDLVSQYGDFGNARTAIIEEVNQIEDPDLRSQTMKESMRLLDDKRRADSEARAAVFEEGESFVMNGGSVEEFKMRNPEGWEMLSIKQQRQLNSGATIETDYTLLSDLLTLPRRELAKVNPTDHFSELSSGDRQKLINAVKSARTGSPESQVGRSRTAETSAVVEQLFGAKKSWGAKDKAQVNAFHALINDEVAFREAQKGSPLSSQEYTAMLADMTRMVVKKESLMGYDNLWPDQEIDIRDIPTDDLRVLSDYLHRNNIPATADNLLRAYEQAK